MTPKNLDTIRAYYKASDELDWETAGRASGPAMCGSIMSPGLLPDQRLNFMRPRRTPRPIAAPATT